MEYKRNELNIARRCMLVAVLFLAIGLCITSGSSFSRFVSDVNGGDSVKVARPVLSVTPLDEAVNFNMLDVGEYRFEVKNSNEEGVSETALTYYIRITLPEGSKVTPTVLMKSESGTYTDTEELTTGYKNETNNIFIFAHDTMYMGCVEESHYYAIKLTATDVTDVKLNVEVLAEQADE